jgi:hypothetical protein
MLNGIKSQGAESMLGAFNSHTYMGGANGKMNTNVPMWLSEQCDLNGQWSTGWTGGAGGAMTWANNVMGGILNNNLGGFLYWEGVQWPNPNTNVSAVGFPRARERAGRRKGVRSEGPRRLTPLSRKK